MTLEIKIASYLKKFLVYQGQDEILIRKSNFWGMLLLAHLKYKDDNCIHNPEKSMIDLNTVMLVQISNSDFKSEAMKKLKVQDYQCRNFSRNISDLFYQHFYDYMKMRVAVNRLVGKKIFLQTMIKDYMNLLKLTEADIAFATMLKRYNRYVKSPDCDIEYTIDKIEKHYK